MKKYIFTLFMLLIGFQVQAQSFIYPDYSTGSSTTLPESAGSVYNCGVSISGTTLTVNGSSGSALTPAAPCYVGVTSAGTGNALTSTFTSNVTVTFGSTSDTDGNTFGLSANDWANSTPFFLGVINNGTNSYFTISRVPISSSGTSTSNICQKTGTNCDNQNDVFILTTGLTLSDWTSLPVTQIGWMNATYSTALSAWTFALNRQTGFNFNYEKTFFLFPTGLFGADASQYLYNQGGTCPVYSAQTYRYKISRNGNVIIQVYFNGDGGADGVGAVGYRLAIPYLYDGNSNTASYLYGQITSPSSQWFGGLKLYNSQNYGEFFVGNTTSTIIILPYSVFTAGVRSFELQGSYTIY